MRSRSTISVACLLTLALLAVGGLSPAIAAVPGSTATTHTGASTTATASTSTTTTTTGSPPTATGTASAPATNREDNYPRSATETRRTTTDPGDASTHASRGDPSVWTNAVRYLLLPGAALGVFVGLVDGLTRAFTWRVRRVVRRLVGIVGAGSIGIAAVVTAVWSVQQGIALAGLGATCAVVAVADRRWETPIHGAGAAGVAVVTTVGTAVAVAGSGAIAGERGPALLAVPAVVAATLFLVGTAAADRGAPTGVALSVIVYCAVAVAAGALTVDANGMGAGLAALVLIAGGAALPVAGAPLYGLGVTESDDERVDTIESDWWPTREN